MAGPSASSRQRGPSIATRTADVLASEWTKIRSVRSTFSLLLVAAVTAIAGSGIVAGSERSTNKPPPLDPVASVFLAWLEYPILAVGILGVLSLTSEYATGQIRTTFAAVPQRLEVLAAKAGITGVVALIFGETLAFASFLTAATFRNGHHGAISLSHPGALGEVLAAGFTLFAIAMVGLALGAIVRHTAGAIAALPALLYLPLLLLTLPHPWNDTIANYSLLMSAYQLVSEHAHPGLLSPPLSWIVLLAWPTTALTVAGLLITTRDA
jgi:ABC-2 type transport system permease protein